MEAILYIGHGTRFKKGAKEATQFLQMVMEKVDVPIQELSFLELTEPFIAEGFERCAARGATQITIVPIFLLAAGHIKHDIPEALAPLSEKYPEIKVAMANPFGVENRILDAIAELVKYHAPDVGPNDSLLLVGRGSSDPAIHRAFASIKQGLGNRLAVERINVCYLAATTPLFSEGIEEISREATGRIIVIPYLLFAGLLLNEVIVEVKSRQKKGQSIIHTGALSSHQVIQDIVIERASGKELIHAAAYH